MTSNVGPNRMVCVRNRKLRKLILTFYILLSGVSEPLVKIVSTIFSLWHSSRISCERLQLQEIEILTNGGLIKRHVFVSEQEVGK